MEFFMWMIVPQIVMQFSGSYAVSTLEEYTDLMIKIQSISLYVAAGLYVLCLALGGYGLMRMANKAGMKYGWLAFFPFLNTWYAGKLAGETALFGKKMKRAGLYAMIVEIVYVAFNIFSLIVWFGLMQPQYYTQQFNSDNTMWVPILELSQIPTGLRWLVTANNVNYYLGTVFDLVIIFFFCVLYFAFFRKYYARSPFIMTILSALLPLRGFVLFAVRNNTPVDYDAWVRRRMQEYAERQQQMYGGYGGQNGQNGYGGQGGSQDGSGGGDPFPGYGGQEGSEAGGANGAGNANGSGGSGGDDPFPDF